MTIEEKLQKYILDKYKSIMQFAKTANLPYTTIKGIFSRGIWGTSIQNITKICNVLSIDINALIDGEIKTKVDPIKKMTSHEHKVISAYRNKPEMQPAVDKLLGVSDEMIAVPMAARSSDNTPVQIIQMSKEELERIRNADPIVNEDDI